MTAHYSVPDLSAAALAAGDYQGCFRMLLDELRTADPDRLAEVARHLHRLLWHIDTAEPGHPLSTRSALAHGRRASVVAMAAGAAEAAARRLLAKGPRGSGRAGPLTSPSPAAGPGTP